MTLDQLAQALKTFPVEVECKHATVDHVNDFRQTLKDDLQRSDRFILVNYLRKAVGQQTGGHISPVAAYDEQKDTALILDVSDYKYPWTWVKVDQLWQAMIAVDDDAKLARGYVIVSAIPKS